MPRIGALAVPACLMRLLQGLNCERLKNLHQGRVQSTGVPLTLIME